MQPTETVVRSRAVRGQSVGLAQIFASRAAYTTIHDRPCARRCTARLCSHWSVAAQRLSMRWPGLFDVLERLPGAPAWLARQSTMLCGSGYPVRPPLTALSRGARQRGPSSNRRRVSPPSRACAHRSRDEVASCWTVGSRSGIDIDIVDLSRGRPLLLRPWHIASTGGTGAGEPVAAADARPAGAGAFPPITRRCPRRLVRPNILVRVTRARPAWPGVVWRSMPIAATAVTRRALASAS